MAALAVLIPLYNHAKYIIAALESVIYQTRKPDRIIVLDDGSTDESLRVVQEWVREKFGPNNRIEVSTQKNSGAHAALNSLVLRAASADDGKVPCELVAILNSDDVYRPTRLQILCEFLEKKSHLQLVCSRLHAVDSIGCEIEESSSRAQWIRAAWNGYDQFIKNSSNSAATSAENLSPNYPSWFGRSNFIITTSNFVARTKWLIDNPFKAYRFSHDYYSAIKAALFDQIEIINEPLLDYRVHEGNTISTKTASLTRELLLLNIELAQELAPQLMTNEKLRRSYSKYREASWRNISAFRADLFELICSLNLPNAKPNELLNQLSNFPELETFPNICLADREFDQPWVLRDFEELILRYADAMRVLDELNESVSDKRDEIKKAKLLLKSRWFSLGKLLGRFNGADLSGRKNSFWIRLGNKLGIEAAIELQRLLSA